MKKLLFNVVVLSFFFFVGNVIAAPVEILSQRYELNVQWNYEIYKYLNYQSDYTAALYSRGAGTYNQIGTNGSPITFSTNSVNPPGLGLIAYSLSEFLGINSSTSIDQFSYSNRSYRGVEGMGMLSTDGNYYYGANQYIITTVQASWLFRPTAGNLEVDVDIFDFERYVSGSSWLKVDLLDITDSTTLIDIKTPINYDFYDSTDNQGGTFLLDVNPNHTYEFLISGWSNPNTLNNYPLDYASQSVTASIESVPEPTTLLLLGLGLLGLAGIRRNL